MIVATALSAAIATGPALARDTGPQLPRVMSDGGHHALIVDGAPFLMLGAQANNASNYPQPLAKVWPVVDAMGANTLEIPVAWQQIEPVEGRFDFSWLDQLLPAARAHDKRLVLLWFGTWKNTSPAYAPDWVKLDRTRFPHMIKADGGTHYAMSPLGAETMAADRRAFVALMTYLRDHDPQNTVIMVQVENEVGSYGSVRDFSPQANALFAGPAPAALLKRFGKVAGSSWKAAFGADADEYFQAWYVARYINAVATAGKAVKPLPMYVNAALADAFGRQSAAGYASGGPVHHVLDIYKVAAPAIDILAPDIYKRDEKMVAAYLNYYDRADNPLFIPEIGNDADYARFFFPAIGHGAIGFAPFGMDATGYSNYPLGARSLDAVLPLFSRIYHVFAPMQRVWAEAARSGRVWGVAEPVDPVAMHTAQLDLGHYHATVTFGQQQFGTDPPVGNHAPAGGIAIARLAPDAFLVTGFDARLSFSLTAPAKGETMEMLRVEEGHYDARQQWVFERVWNGDLLDWGINFTGEPHVLRVQLVTFRNDKPVPSTAR